MTAHKPDAAAVREEAEAYIAAEAWNVDDSYARAARIMRALLDQLAEAESNA